MTDASPNLIHPFAPVADAHSRVLVLGSFPSVRSRAEGFYYGHPQNRFWRMLADLYGVPMPMTVQQKRELLLSRGIALWDAAASCCMTGSADASMRQIVPNDITAFLQVYPTVQSICCNGQTAWRIVQKSFTENIPLPCRLLPSTSAANASYSLDRLIAAWRDALW